MSRRKDHSLLTREGENMPRDLFIWPDIDGGAAFGPQELIPWEELDENLAERYPEVFAYEYELVPASDHTAHLKGFRKEVRVRAAKGIEAGKAYFYELFVHKSCPEHTWPCCEGEVIGVGHVVARRGLEGCYGELAEIPIEKVRDLAKMIIGSHGGRA